eukprot:SAG31_NODE_6719_length_1912_cov_1.275786_2_plen_83_part_00
MACRVQAALSVLWTHERARGALFAEAAAAVVDGLMQAMLPIHLANTFGIGPSKVSMMVAIAVRAQEDISDVLHSSCVAMPSS